MSINVDQYIDSYKKSSTQIETVPNAETYCRTILECFSVMREHNYPRMRELADAVVHRLCMGVQGNPAGIHQYAIRLLSKLVTEFNTVDEALNHWLFQHKVSAEYIQHLVEHGIVPKALRVGTDCLELFESSEDLRRVERLALVDRVPNIRYGFLMQMSQLQELEVYLSNVPEYVNMPVLAKLTLRLTTKSTNAESHLFVKSFITDLTLIEAHETAAINLTGFPHLRTLSVETAGSSPLSDITYVSGKRAVIMEYVMEHNEPFAFTHLKHIRFNSHKVFFEACMNIRYSFPNLHCIEYEDRVTEFRWNTIFPWSVKVLDVTKLTNVSNVIQSVGPVELIRVSDGVDCLHHCEQLRQMFQVAVETVVKE